jgi:hypothetical protein
MRASDEVVVKLNGLICNFGPSKGFYDALAPFLSELSGLFGICHEVGDSLCEIMCEFVGI